MNELQFYTALKLGWLNAWIPIFALVLIQFVYMLLFREGGKRAVDVSWYKPKDRLFGMLSTILQMAILLISLFIPLKVDTTWFAVGCILFAVAMAGMISAFQAYMKTPQGETVSRGIYRYSRNPMYFFFFIGVIAACVASASLWLLILSIPFILATHGIILSEERYCTETYGKAYLDYKKQVARYFGRKE